MIAVFYKNVFHNFFVLDLEHLRFKTMTYARMQLEEM